MGRVNDVLGPTIYLDANTLIHAVEDTGALGDAMRRLFNRIDGGEFQSVTSELSLAEVLVVPIRRNNTSIRQEYEQLFNLAGGLDILPISRAILIHAAELRASGPSLKLPDAIHAATAMRHGCTTFLTNDRRFESVPDLPVLLLSKWHA